MLWLSLGERYTAAKHHGSQKKPSDGYSQALVKRVEELKKTGEKVPEEPCQPIRREQGRLGVFRFPGGRKPFNRTTVFAFMRGPPPKPRAIKLNVCSDRGYTYQMRTSVVSAYLLIISPYKGRLTNKPDLIMTVAKVTSRGGM